MTPDRLSAIAGTLGLILFCLLFAGVLIYALWPGNKGRFSRAARQPLMDDREALRDAPQGDQE